MSGVVGEAGDGGAQAFVAGPSPANASGSSALVCDGSDAGLRGEMILALEAEADAHVAQLGGVLGGADFSGARKRHDDLSFRQLSHGMLDAAGEPGDLDDEAFESADQNKPDGLFVITPKMGPAFVEELPVGKFHGVGPATTRKMNQLGIETGRALRDQSLAFLQQHFGKAEAFYYWIARGIDERPVRADRIRKSVGAEDTFSEDMFTLEAARAALEPLIEKVWRYCED